MFFCDLRFLLHYVCPAFCLYMAVIAPHWRRAPRFPLIRIFKGNRRFAPCNPDYAPKMRPRLRACLCRLLHFICALQAFLRRSASIPHGGRLIRACLYYLLRFILLSGYDEKSCKIPYSLLFCLYFFVFTSCILSPANTFPHRRLWCRIL